MFLKCDIIYQTFWDEDQMEHNVKNFSKIRVLLTRLSNFSRNSRKMMFHSPRKISRNVNWNFWLNYQSRFLKPDQWMKVHEVYFNQ